MTLPVSRPCQTAAGDDCEGEFKKKIRETYERKDGEWVMFKREQSQDGGKTWSALPMSLAERASSLSDEEASALIPKDSCCLPEKRIETCPDYQENGHGDPQFCPQWKTIMVNAQKTCKDKDATLSAGASKFTDCLCPQMCKEVDALKAAGWPKETSEHVPIPPALFKSQHDGKCLDYHMDSTNVYMHGCHGGNNQKWYLEGELFKSQHDGKCLDYNFNNGNVYMHGCHGGNNQKWYSEGGQFKSRHDGKCLDYNFNNGNVYMHGCHGGSNQKWEFR